MSAAAAPASDGEESAESGSLDQSARSGAGEPGQGLSVEALAARIHRKLALGDATVLPVKYHRAAVNSMAQLRTALLPGSAAVSREARLYLLYAGIAVQRRMHIDAAADEVADLEVSLALLFALQILCQERSATPAPEERASPSLAHSPEKQARLDGRKRGREEEEDELAEADGPPRPARCEHSEQLENWDEQRLQELLEPAEGWQEALRPTPDSVCRACIAVGRRMGSAASMARVVGLARVFFRCSALTLVYNMLGSQPVREANRPNFLTLGSLDFLQEANDQRDERLAALVDAAESEAGQQVLRDLILSFSLPARVVGVRRTPLLGREANRVATEQHTAELQEAHEAAMRGAEWSWKHDQNPTHKMCALLAGLCITFAGRGGSADAIRKKDAFRGRVHLPFLETAAARPGDLRISFVPHRHEWVVYTVGGGGKPTVQLKHAGLEGLCQAALLATRA